LQNAALDADAADEPLTAYTTVKNASAQIAVVSAGCTELGTTGRDASSGRRVRSCAAPVRALTIDRGAASAIDRSVVDNAGSGGVVDGSPVQRADGWRRRHLAAA